ncbi:Arc-like repressor [Vibrio phage vB_VpaM_XM1]
MIVKAAKCNTTFFGELLRLDKDFLVIEDDDQKGLQAAKAEIKAGVLVEVDEKELNVEDMTDEQIKAGVLVEVDEKELNVEDMTDEQLKAVAKQLKIKGYSNMKRDTLIEAIESHSEEGEE